MRRQIFARDHHRCTVPGCRSARNLDLHHVEYQRDGGTHDLRRVQIFCDGGNLIDSARLVSVALSGSIVCG
jgi:hypothetical protein